MEPLLWLTETRWHQQSKSALKLAPVYYGPQGPNYHGIQTLTFLVPIFITLNRTRATSINDAANLGTIFQEPCVHTSAQSLELYPSTALNQM